jgi:hypothetical protein
MTSKFTSHNREAQTFNRIDSQKKITLAESENGRCLQSLYFSPRERLRSIHDFAMSAVCPLSFWRKADQPPAESVP